MVKKKALLQARELTGENVETELKRVEEWLLLQRVGNPYNDKQNYAIQQDNIFGSTCAVMQLKGIADPELLSVFKWYKLLQALEPKN